MQQQLNEASALSFVPSLAARASTLDRASPFPRSRSRSLSLCPVSLALVRQLSRFIIQTATTDLFQSPPLIVVVAAPLRMQLQA